MEIKVKNFTLEIYEPVLIYLPIVYLQYVLLAVDATVAAAWSKTNSLPLRIHSQTEKQKLLINERTNERMNKNHNIHKCEENPELALNHHKDHCHWKYVVYTLMLQHILHFHKSTSPFRLSYTRPKQGILSSSTYIHAFELNHHHQCLVCRSLAPNNFHLDLENLFYFNKVYTIYEAQYNDHDADDDDENLWQQRILDLNCVIMCS